MLKCPFIVCLSFFVCLTNEVYSGTGWETRGGGGESHNGSRCTRTANICTAVSVANNYLPPEEKGNCLLINGSVTDTYIQGRLHQPVSPILIPLLLPANPFSPRQLPRCILATYDIVEVKLKSLVWMWCACYPRMQCARHIASHTLVSVTLLV